MQERSFPETLEVMDDATAEKLRSKTYAERLELVFELNRIGRQRLAESLKKQHPDWDEKLINEEVNRAWIRGDHGIVIYASEIL